MADQATDGDREIATGTVNAPDASQQPKTAPKTALQTAPQPAPKPAAAEPQAEIRAAGLPPETKPGAPAPQGDRSMVLIVRDGVRGPEDLEGRRIATGLSSEAPDDLKRMVQKSAGVSVSPVAIGWSAGLASLARGEIDGVLLSLGPRIAASETEGVTLAGYQLLEIPLASMSP